MSWESTSSYYKALNEGVKEALGGLHSAQICMYSVDFQEIETLQRQGEWAQTARILGRAAKSVEAGGADFLLICTNTMHKVAEEIGDQISIPILHIADATAEKLKADNIACAGLLGTAFTMEQDFYKGRLADKHGIEVLVPDAEQRALVHAVIYEELCQGKILDSSRQKYLEVIASLHERGAQAIVLGCTEIAMLVQQEHTSVPLYDTTEIHALEAVRRAIS
jgi:aspartate racemase